MAQDRMSLREQAYRFLHGKIASGSLPAGSLVSELSLAKELGISRTPVREAIGRLISEGLVEQIPRHGTIVRNPDRRDLAELYEVREALESYAAAEAARRIGAEDLKLLDELLARMRELAREVRQSGATVLTGPALQQFLAADMGFHSVLIRATGNRRITRIIAEMGVMVRIFGFQRQAHTPGIVTRTCRFHAQVLKAVRCGDADLARRWMVRHLRTSKRQALEALDIERRVAEGWVVPLAYDLPDAGFDAPPPEASRLSPPPEADPGEDQP